MNDTTSSPSSGYNFVDAAKQPIIISFSVGMTFIVITSILNLCVLCRRTLRSSPCTYYFLASVPPVLAYTFATPFSAIISNRYGFYINNTYVSCKVFQYVLYIAPFLYSSMLVCASIDRFFASSTSTRLRRLSQVRIARRIIIIVWIVVFIYLSPFIAIYRYEPNSTSSNKCILYSTTLISVYLITRVVMYYLMMPIILGIFGLLTIYNIRNQTRRVAPVNQTNVHRRTEGQLARMLIIQVAVYFLFFTPSGVIYVLLTFVPSMNTLYYTTIRNLTNVWQQGGYFISFFLYVFTGKVYREELKKMLKWNKIRDQVSYFTVQRTVIGQPTTAFRNTRV